MLKNMVKRNPILMIMIDSALDANKKTKLNSLPSSSDRTTYFAHIHMRNSQLSLGIVFMLLKYLILISFNLKSGLFF